MSWGIEIVGTKEGTKKRAADQLDKLAVQYAGKPEAEDIAACKDRILALVDATALGVDGYGMDWNAVKVSANGSHGITNTPVDGLTNASFSVSVTRTSLAL